jgi:tetratricopeptide (TPR) repeat protein
MIQNTLTLIESRSILATVGRESGRLDDAKSSFGDALSSIEKQLAAHADATNRRIYFQVLLESTLLECSRGGATAVKIGALVDALRDHENSVRKNPENSIVRCRAVAGYLAIGQLFAASGATNAALENLNRAAELIAPGLETTPDHRRLRALESRVETARGDALYQSGKKDEASATANRALAVALKLAGEDPSYFYDLACALSLKARLNAPEPGPAVAAVAALRKAVDFGFDNVYKLRNDEYLEPIRGRVDFQRLVVDAEKKAVGTAVGPCGAK